MFKFLLLGILLLILTPVSFAQEGDVQQQFEGFNLVGYSDEGEKSWDINGDTADIQGDQVDITNVNANAYGEQTLNLKARKGLVDKATGDVKLKDNVVITNEDGSTMKTDSLDWKRNDDLVTTQDIVTLEDEIMKIKGHGMEAKPGLKEAKLNKNVEATIDAETPEKNKSNTITIECDGPMEVDQIKQIAVFNDNVVATEETTGRILKSDRMEVYFNEETRKIKELVCIGNVSAQQGENVTYAEKLIYKVDEQRLMLSGSPRLIFTTTEDSSGIDF